MNQSDDLAAYTREAMRNNRVYVSGSLQTDSMNDILYGQMIRAGDQRVDHMNRTVANGTVSYDDLARAQDTLMGRDRRDDLINEMKQELSTLRLVKKLYDENIELGSEPVRDINRRLKKMEEEREHTDKHKQETEVT